MNRMFIYSIHKGENIKNYLLISNAFNNNGKNILRNTAKSVKGCFPVNLLILI